MYSECFVCGRSFGENGTVSRLRVGRRIVFDVERGRLWIVCRRCGQWCLTPLDERWETIEECESLFARAEARVSTKNVGLARLADVELIRIGTTGRDEIANWRYGPRFVRRRRRVRALGAGLALGSGAIAALGVYGATVLAIDTGSAFVGVWLVFVGGLWLYKLRGITRWTPVTILRLPDGTRRLLRRGDLSTMRLACENPRRTVRVQVALDDTEIAYTRDDAMNLLARILPHVNWQGGSPLEISAAAREIDRVEEKARAAWDGKHPLVWERLVAPGGYTQDHLLNIDVVRRLALEMAVAEELEHRAMAGEAMGFAVEWPRHEEIAAQSDDMFLPRWIGEWIRFARRRPARALEDTDVQNTDRTHRAARHDAR